MSGAAYIAHVRAQLRNAQVERARHRAIYEPLIGSSDPEYFAALYGHAVADIWCARLDAEVTQRRAA